MRELPSAIVQERMIEEARTSLKEVISLILEMRSDEDQAENVIARESITVRQGIRLKGNPMRQVLICPDPEDGSWGAR